MIANSALFGAQRDRVGCGVSVGITPTVEALLEQVDGYLARGYLRVKLKIEPGTDVERVRAVREAHPDILLSVDANAAYRLEDAGVFRELDAFDLLMMSTFRLDSLFVLIIPIAGLVLGLVLGITTPLAALRGR